VTGFEGTAALARLAVRRDRVRLPVWLLGVSGITFFAGHAMSTTFPTPEAIQAYGASASSSAALIALSGPPIALDTLAGIVLNKVELMTVLGVALMAVFEVVRHTRGEEEEGRTELVRAGVVGRHAGLAAALVVASAASVLLGLLVALGLAGASVPAGSSMLYGAGTAGLGLVFAGIGLCLAQVFTRPRAALGAAMALLGGAYVLRAAGDVRGDALVWASPIGWSQATHVLGRERWWPLLICVLAWLLLAAAAVWLSGRRDVGAGLVAARTGAPGAGPLLSGPLGLAVRLQRATVVAWSAGLFLVAAMFGSLTKAVEEMARDNPAIVTYMRATGQGTFVDAFLATMMLVIALLTSGFAVSSALRLHAEETAGRAEAVLATALSRARWVGGGLTVAVVGTVLLLVAGGLGLGLAYGLVAGDPGQAPRLAVLELFYVPAVLSLAGLAVLLDGWRPEWVGVAWAGLAACFVIGWLGPLLDLPQWASNLSPFTHVPHVPVDAGTWAGPAYTLLAVVLLVGLGWAGLRRRDLPR
jgi:ABC-2 type transport system permease protein